MQLATATPKIQQIISLAHTLSNEQQDFALEYLRYLAWQNKNTHSIKIQKEIGLFDDVFGILTTKQGVSIDEMNETIAQCGSESYE